MRSPYRVPRFAKGIQKLKSVSVKFAAWSLETLPEDTEIKFLTRMESFVSKRLRLEIRRLRFLEGKECGISGGAYLFIWVLGDDAQKWPQAGDAWSIWGSNEVLSENGGGFVVE